MRYKILITTYAAGCSVDATVVEFDDQNVALAVIERLKTEPPIVGYSSNVLRGVTRLW